MFNSLIYIYLFIEIHRNTRTLESAYLSDFNTIIFGSWH